MKNRKHAERAFTFSELLAIIAVTCCLALVVLPTLAKSETRGTSIACRNNHRLMMAAFHMYADENNSYFPANQDVQRTWISIQEPASMTNLLTPQNFRFLPYVPPNRNILKCPADISVTLQGGRQPKLRSISMSQAVGTKSLTKEPVDGIWLNGGSHVANRDFYCYAKTSDMIDPVPAGLWVFIDEHPESINDGGFGNVGPIPTGQYRMIDYPAGWHDGAGTLGFADGHVEEKKWVDPRTVPPLGRFPGLTTQPNNPDITWLANRTTAPVAR